MRTTFIDWDAISETSALYQKSNVQVEGASAGRASVRAVWGAALTAPLLTGGRAAHTNRAAADGAGAGRSDFTVSASEQDQKLF